ncbi:enoyl-CoA hydratase/isomerase family protein [Paraburkholderia caffeinilytica]|uniref:enoyl-CoA hydratase/isomerase family protein n=1 Tax=Paraburkholderia caffeinilytica TaxID=1761016 RepID=UPI003D9FFCB3
MTPFVHLSRDGAVLVIEIDNPPPGATFAQTARQELIGGLLAARADATIDAIILCATNHPCEADAEITGLDLGGMSHPDSNDIFNAIEDLARPVVAVLHGTVLSGRLELALLAHYRIAVASTTFRLPEVKLEISQGTGGTQHLPRIAGMRDALDRTTGGTPISARKAQELGIVDVVVENGLREAAFKLVHELVANGTPPRRARDLSLDSSVIHSNFSNN